MTEYRRQLVAGSGRFRNALAQLAQLPWFVKNLGLKVLVITRLKKGPWPY
jgi:hypothetical protein